MVNVFDTSVESFAVRGVLPMVMSRIEILHVPSADLQRRVDVQVLVERRNRTLGLARRVVELWMGTVFEFGNVRRTTVVYYQADVLKGKTKLFSKPTSTWSRTRVTVYTNLSVPKHVDLMPFTVVQTLLGFHLEFQRTGTEVDE